MSDYRGSFENNDCSSVMLLCWLMFPCQDSLNGDVYLTQMMSQHTVSTFCQVYPNDWNIPGKKGNDSLGSFSSVSDE